MGKKVLISGGAGFIGSHTADVLSQRGYEIRILDNLSSKTHSGTWPGYLSKDYELIQGDVRYKKHWEKALKGVDYVIHLAAWMDMRPEFSQFASTNVTGTSNLYETIVSKNYPINKVVVASSQFVYGQGKWHCKKDGEVFPVNRTDERLSNKKWDPECPLCSGEISYAWSDESHNNPPNQYAITKLTQELMAVTIGELYLIPSTALRFSIVHGSRQTLKNAYSGALRIFAMQMKGGSTPSIFEDGLQLRDYVHVLDVADAIRTVMENNESDYQAYNVGGGKAYTVLELANMIARQVGYHGEIAPNAMYRVGDTRHIVSDITKLKKLGWKPKRSEKQAIADFIDWIESQGGIDDITKASNQKMIREGVLRVTT